MSSFRPPLRKRTVENSLTDELCCSEDHVSTQNSQEVLSCGFLPPKQLKRTPFRPPLRDLVSPGQSYITCILHEEEEERRGITSSGLTSNFELAPLSKSNNQDINNEGNTTLKSVPKKHHYYYHIGNRKIEQPAVKTVLHNRPVEATGNKPTTFSAEQNESRFKIFEFQLSQATEKSKPTSEISSEITKPNEKSLAQHHVTMDIIHSIKKARDEIRKIRRRYAAKRAGCFIQEPPSLQEDRQPLKVSVNLLTKEKLPRDTEMQAFFLSPEEQQSILVNEE